MNSAATAVAAVRRREPESVQRIPASFLPPIEHRPNVIFALPQLQYPLALNAAAELVDRPIARGWAGRPAYLFGERRITYAELARDVNRLGNALIGLGIRPGERVMLRIPDRPEHVVSLLALLKIGAIAVPTFTLLRAPDLIYREQDTEAVALIADSRLLEEVEKARPSFQHVSHFVSIGPAEAAGYLDYEKLLDAGSADLTPAPTRRDDISMVLYTSGSTGEPKGCCESHSDLLAVSDGFGNYMMPFRENDVIAGQPPLAFSMGIGVFLSWPLRFGVPAVLVEEKRPEVLLDAIERHRVTVFAAVPTFYNMMANTALAVRRDTWSIRQFRSSGEMLTPGIQAKVVDRFGIPVREAMGSGESLHMIASYRWDEPVREACFGRPIPGFEIAVCDPDTFEELPRGEAGLLSFRGPTGTKYWRKPEIQAMSVRNGWSVLQDRIRMDDEGFCYYLGRQDELIVSAGYNIAPTEVESILARHPHVLESACIGAPDPEGVRAQVVKACIVLRDGVAASPELAREIQAFFKQNGAPHLYPRVIEFVAALPKTASGKTRRLALNRS